MRYLDRFPTEHGRSAGGLSPHDVRIIVTRVLAPQEVLILARAVSREDTATLNDERKHIAASYRGGAGGGLIYSIEKYAGIRADIEATNPDDAARLGVQPGSRSGTITWHLTLAVLRDGTTPDRLAALATALAAEQAHRRSFISCPGTYADGAAWDRHYGKRYYRKAANLRQAAQHAAAAITMAGPEATQLDLFAIDNRTAANQ